MNADEVVSTYIAAPLVAAGFRRSGKRRLVASAENTVYVDVVVRADLSSRVTLQLKWGVVPRVWEEFHRSRGEKRLRDAWAITRWYVALPDDEFGYVHFVGEQAAQTGARLRQHLAEEVVPFLLPRTTAEGLREWDYLEGSLASLARVVASIDHVSVDQARALLAQYPLVRTDPKDAARFEFLAARVDARAAAQELTPEQVVHATGSVPDAEAGTPVSAAITGQRRVGLGAYGSVLVCRVVPGLAVLAEDADELGSVTSLGGSWVMARYPGSTMGKDPYDVLESLAADTGVSVLVGMVFDDFAVDVTGFSARAGFWRMLLPDDLDGDSREMVLVGQPDRGRLESVGERAAAVSAWAAEAGLRTDEATLRSALTAPSDGDDPTAADTALDALLAAVGLIHQDIDG